MKAFAIAAIASLCFAAWGQNADDPIAKAAVKAPRHRLAKDFAACPDGHKALKDIPIVYGLVGPLHKKPEDYNEEDKKLKWQYDRGEIVFGSDVIEENSPKFRVRCRTCGYTFHESTAVFPQGLVNLSTWSRSAPSPSRFRLAFSKRLLEVPVLDVVKGSLSYSQSVDTNGKEVEWEMVTYQSTAAPVDIVARVRKWTEELKWDAALLKRNEHAAAFHTYWFEDETVSLRIIDDQFWNPGQVNVSFSERRQHPKDTADKTGGE